MTQMPPDMITPLLDLAKPWLTPLANKIGTAFSMKSKEDKRTDAEKYNWTGHKDPVAEDQYIDSLSEYHLSVLEGGNPDPAATLQRINNPPQFPEIEFRRRGPARNYKHATNILSHFHAKGEAVPLMGQYREAKGALAERHYNLNNGNYIFWGTPGALSLSRSITPEMTPLQLPGWLGGGDSVEEYLYKNPFVMPEDKDYSPDRMLFGLAPGRGTPKQRQNIGGGGSQAYYAYVRNPQLTREGLLNDMTYNLDTNPIAGDATYQHVYEELMDVLFISPDDWNKAMAILVDDMVIRLHHTTKANTQNNHPADTSDHHTGSPGLFAARTGYFEQGNIFNLQSEYEYLPTWGEQRMAMIYEIMKAAKGNEVHPLIGKIIAPRGVANTARVNGIWDAFTHQSYEKHGFRRFVPDAFEVVDYYYRDGKRYYEGRRTIDGQGTIGIQYKLNQEWVGSNDTHVMLFPWTKDRDHNREDLDYTTEDWHKARRQWSAGTTAYPR